jgi:hypothetical protein
MVDSDYRIVDRGYYFKFYNPTTDIKLIRYFLEENGFMELFQAGGGASAYRSNIPQTLNGSFL